MSLPHTARSIQLAGWMDLALSEAALTAGSGDVPIGAVVLDADGRVIGTGRNRREECGDPTAHAEVLALREAAAQRLSLIHI